MAKKGNGGCPFVNDYKPWIAESCLWVALGVLSDTRNLLAAKWEGLRHGTRRIDRMWEKEA